MPVQHTPPQRQEIRDVTGLTGRAGSESRLLQGPAISLRALGLFPKSGKLSTELSHLSSQAVVSRLKVSQVPNEVGGGGVLILFGNYKIKYEMH
ncbi:unnamed protein product [Arctia plantaginis]|uniref:Uncharacterized protein n=1 Tax=Arctia plantaginis TaxID=874455 RepID=A0A8S1B9T8_ARCPL|nr:unnamed protein product [Arctia plantaginis]